MDAPRAIMEVAGVNVRWNDLLDIQVDNTLYLAADSFEATFRNDLLLSDWFRKNQEVRIYMGYVGNPQAWTKEELTHIFTGRIDGIKPDFSSSMTVRLLGRDYSAPMIDTEYSVAYQERTSSQVAQHLASKYGLTPRITATTAMVDRELFANKKEWEVLQALADLEGFVCYVNKNKELYFGPRQDIDEQVITKLYYRLDGYSNCRITFDDSAVGVVNKVTVRHWTGKNKRLIEASAVNESLLAAMGGQVKERIVYVAKATTVALAQSYAEKKLQEWSRQVVTGEGLSALNLMLEAERKTLCQGYGRFSGEYYVEQARQILSKQEGARTEFTITNIRPDTAEQYRQDLYDQNEKRM
ncbi:phage late control D family protein [Desulforamulus ruminis]|nr:hypothetical protein [Desulforamulus ruminis]